MQSSAGNAPAAIKALKEAVRLAPQEAEYHYNLALAWSETGNISMKPSRASARRSDCAGFGRAWYNLALALNSQGKVDEALKTLQQAEAADPRDASIPYAAATVIRYDRKEEAMAAVAQSPPDSARSPGGTAARPRPPGWPLNRIVTALSRRKPRSPIDASSYHDSMIYSSHAPAQLRIRTPL